MSALVSPGCCLKTQARVGEVRLLAGKLPGARSHIGVRRLLSSRLARRVHRLVSRGRALVRTYRLEIGSLLARIQYIRRKDLVGRYEMGPACLSCLKRGTPQRCRETQAYIQHMQQLHSLHPWLSYSDSNLLLEGWVLVFQSRLDSLDCGMASDLGVAESLGDSSLQTSSAVESHKAQQVYAAPSSSATDQT